MTVKQNDKLKAMQAELKGNEVLAELTIGKLTIPQVKELEQVIANVLLTLAQEDKVNFADVGSFEVKDTAARKGVNPAKLKELKEQGVDAETAKAQAAVDIAAGRKLAWSTSKTVKDELKA